MKLSVATVVFNDAKHIEKTILSVISQTYNEIEYIVIDGNSNDGTKEIIQKYIEKISFFVSEPDKGLYDAMNKALKVAKGDFICFLNSGDLFFENNTVEKIFMSGKGEIYDIYYGDTVVVDEEGNIKGKRRHRPPENLNWKSFKNGMLVSHQAFIPALKLVEPYDLSIKYSSDFDWCIKIMKKTDKICNTKEILIRYLDGGLTKKRFFKSLKERFRIMSKNYGFFTTVWIHIRNSIRMSFFAIKNKWI